MGVLNLFYENKSKRIIYECTWMWNLWMLFIKVFQNCGMLVVSNFLPIFMIMLEFLSWQWIWEMMRCKSTRISHEAFPLFWALLNHNYSSCVSPARESNIHHYMSGVVLLCLLTECLNRPQFLLDNISGALIYL